MELQSLTLEDFKNNESVYSKLIEDRKNWSNIPLLNYTRLDDLRDLSLVRFRGMIQDMFDPEMYLEQYKIVSTESSERIQDGKYRDTLVLKPGEAICSSSPVNKYGERRTMFTVSIPGLNSWASQLEEASVNKNIHKTKETKNINNSLVFKRPLDDSSIITDTEMIDVQCKKMKSMETVNCSEPRESYLSSEFLLNSPLPDRPSKACMVKIYDNFNDYVLNSIVDVVGFLSVDPSLDGSTDTSTDFQDACEIQAANPSPSLIPRIHAVAVKILNHPNPLLDITFLGNDTNQLNFESIRKSLHIVLTQCLFGDELAATYLLSHLISTVYARSELQTLGQFSLNICNIPSNALPGYTTELYEILESLLPVSHYFPMTLDNLNTVQFTPKKDYKVNKLISGLLQLAPHTHLILDETRLLPGKLEENGVLSIKKIAHLIKSQQIKGDFQFYEIDFNTDIPVLILSEGRSMLPHNCQIYLNPDKDSIGLISETLKAAKFYLQSNLNAIRKFLTEAKLQEFNINSLETEMIEKDFVEIRKTDKNFGAEDLHSLLVFSRLYGIAQGKQHLDQEIWRISKDLETERKRRIYENKKH